jgi:hypothetical protein
MIHAINAVHGKHAFTSLENQHRFEHEIETILDRHWFMPENSLIEDPSIAEKDAKFHTVQISVGVNTETKYTRRLVHTSFAFSKMKDAPSLEEQWQKAQKTLANIQSAFGRKVEIKIVKNHEKLSVA